MLITESSILIGEQIFWDNHSTSLENIFKLLVGNLSMRGTKYLNLVFEAILKRFPLEGSSMLLSTGVVTIMLKSCGETYINKPNCEPSLVIDIYLSVLSRIIITLPDKITFVCDVVNKCNNFGSAELVSFHFHFIVEQLHCLPASQQSCYM